ncbi:hypothetical protein EBME_0498 [bacterium endosymbiont of Mortierella elongata FMR23-6]|nr:hypothetical protein EBME_0498 [bacterium endosymbiont of Mortierella elongata FMR23-6]
MHKSIQDYFVARALWEGLRGDAKSHDVVSLPLECIVQL